jgi:hypothetical protein
VEIDILKIRRKYIYFFVKGHADTISRITIPPNQGDVIAWEKKIRKRSGRVKINIQEFRI